MQKVEIEIIAISQNHNIYQMQSYTVILGEKNGLRKIPIMIGNSEAQSIIIVMEKMTPARPLTHDLFLSFMEKLNAKVVEVLIYKLEKNIFFSKIIFEMDGEIYDIDSRTSDAVAIALRCHCPIYTLNDVIKDAGVIIENDQFEVTQDDVSSQTPDMEIEEISFFLKNMTIKELQTLLDAVVEKEDYQKAIKIRNEIESRKKKK